ncbi:MAG: energy transducer TonB [Candidatus Zixiibacteriota bacterium]
MKSLIKMSRPRYGAFELKAKYRRNMLLGTMLSSLLAIATTAGAFLFTQSNPRPVIDEKDSKPDTFIVILDEKFKVIPEKPKSVGSKPPKINVDGSIIVPVEEDDPINVDVTVRSLTDAYLSGSPGDGVGEILDYIDNPFYGNGGGGDGEYPHHETFIICEIYPEMIYEHPPEYPRIAQTAGQEGVVWIKALIDIDGSVRDAMVFVSSNENAGFDEAALKAAYKCRYKPGIQNGRPVPVWVSYQVDFVLEGSW